MPAPAIAPIAAPAAAPLCPLTPWRMAGPRAPPTSAPASGSPASACVDRVAVATRAAVAAMIRGFLNIAGSPCGGAKEGALQVRTRGPGDGWPFLQAVTSGFGSHPPGSSLARRQQPDLVRPDYPLSGLEIPATSCGAGIWGRARWAATGQRKPRGASAAPRDRGPRLGG